MCDLYLKKIINYIYNFSFCIKCLIYPDDEEPETKLSK